MADTKINDLVKSKTSFQDIAPSDSVHVDQLDKDTASAIIRTQELSDQITPVLPQSAESLKNKATSFPNLALAAVLTGVAMENNTHQKINGHIKESERHQKNIDRLLNLSVELNKDGVKELTPEAKTILDQLKQEGIDLWKKESNEISKEEISGLKSSISSQIDNLRSSLQIIFSTKLQSLIQTIGTIMECVKNIIQNNTRLINSINRLPGH